MGKQSTSSLQVFRAGRHMTMAGQSISFGEADLQATCRAYDPKLHEAPLVIGHPTHDGPAYGWVQSLAFSEGGIDATPDQVNTDFADMVAAGAFKKISASFYSPDSPQNPTPGVYYLRHVGFLGAQPPSVKGLRSPSFADGEAGVVEFSEWDDVDNASLWRRMREWLIGRFGQDEADKVVPGYTVQSLEQSAQDEVRQEAADTADTAVATPAFAEPNSQLNKESIVTPAEKAALEAENARLASELAASRARIAANEAAKAHNDNLAFCEALITQGRMLPAWRDMAVATLDHFAAQPAVLEFGEGEAKAPLADAFKGMLTALPVQVEFGESATTGKAAGEAASVSFAAPQGFVVDPVGMAMHQRAKAYQAANKVDYVAAVAAVQAQA